MIFHMEAKVIKNIQNSSKEIFFLPTVQWKSLQSSDFNPFFMTFWPLAEQLRGHLLTKKWGFIKPQAH